jgi:putative copper export protein
MAEQVKGRTSQWQTTIAYLISSIAMAEQVKGRTSQWQTTIAYLISSIDFYGHNGRYSLKYVSNFLIHIF